MSRIEKLKVMNKSWKAIEGLCRNYWLQKDDVVNAEFLKGDDNISSGDMVVTLKNGYSFIIEIKKGKPYFNKIKLGGDWVYLNEGGKGYYIQENSTGNEIGWLRNPSEAEVLMVFIVETSELYIIYNWKEVKEKIVLDVNNYIANMEGIEDFKPLESCFYSRNIMRKYKYINDTLEFFINVNDRKKNKCGKDTIAIGISLDNTLELNYKADMDILDVELKEKSPSTGNRRTR